jgi:tetratricopeptide (TPR) repeat protein
MNMPVRRKLLANEAIALYAVHMPGKNIAIALISLTTALRAAAADPAREQVIKIVTQIQRADYEGDRPSLKRLHAELAPFVKKKNLASRVHYWRAFALWRRAMNGFNDNVDQKELRADMLPALDDFDAAAAQNPEFVDAKIGALSCLSYLAYQDQSDPARVQEFITKGRQLRKDIEAVAPGNPRFLWVMGPNIWWAPPERGGSQAKAMEMYKKGLEAIRKTKAGDPLDPSWGEPELLMNLAWSNLNRAAPDLNAAEQYARSALELIPYWHYVRDILLPQIGKTKTNQK